jgi:hypothetical protein
MNDNSAASHESKLWNVDHLASTEPSAIKYNKKLIVIEQLRDN